jgi:hypothetical protein
LGIALVVAAGALLWLNLRPRSLTDRAVEVAEIGKAVPMMWLSATEVELIGPTDGGRSILDIGSNKATALTKLGCLMTQTGYGIEGRISPVTREMLWADENGFAHVARLDGTGHETFRDGPVEQALWLADGQRWIEVVAGKTSHIVIRDRRRPGWKQLVPIAGYVPGLIGLRPINGVYFVGAMPDDRQTGGPSGGDGLGL